MQHLPFCLWQLHSWEDQPTVRSGPSTPTSAAPSPPALARAAPRSQLGPTVLSLPPTLSGRTSPSVGGEP